MSDELATVPVAELIERLAARTPAPGGGSGAATAVALAAALLEMSARFGADAGAGADVTEAAQLRSRALALVDLDASAFAPVLDAVRAGADPEPARAAAAQPPLAVAQLAARVAELAAARAQAGNPNLRGDAVTATLLAEAGGRAAAELVAINLTDPADPRRDQAAQAAGVGAGARERALAAVGEE